VRREAFEAAGGLEAIRAEVVDDVAMGRRLKALRGRFRLVLAVGEIRVRMYRGFRAAFAGFTKNLYSAFGRRLTFGIPSFLVDLAVHTLPAALFGLSWVLPALEPLRMPAGFAVCAGVVCNAATALWTGQPLWIALAFPLRSVLWFAMFLRSAWVYHTRGILWRGRSYKG
jgi:chlorobactene glucosyltransferase